MGSQNIINNRTIYNRTKKNQADQDDPDKCVVENNYSENGKRAKEASPLNQAQCSLIWMNLERHKDRGEW